MRYIFTKLLSECFLLTGEVEFLAL